MFRIKLYPKQGLLLITSNIIPSYSYFRIFYTLNQIQYFSKFYPYFLGKNCKYAAKINF